MKSYKIVDYDIGKMDLHTGAGLILWSPDHSSLLLVLDERSNKWSFPKGRIESCDLTILHTMVREVNEETRLSYMLDYELYDRLYTFGNIHCMFEGAAVHTFLTPPNHKEHIKEIRYVPLSDISTLNVNYYVNTWVKWLQSLKIDTFKSIPQLNQR
jgi:8-oxo-dGTP pyrophosphatase MutT (NUDIX family)